MSEPKQEAPAIEVLLDEPAPSVDTLFDRTETRAERRARRRAVPEVAAKLAVQEPLLRQREADRLAAEPKLDDLIAFMESYFGCPLEQVTKEMVANSIFRAPTSAEEAIEREKAIAAQFRHAAESMSTELLGESATREDVRAFYESMAGDIMRQYREHGGEE